MSYLRGFLPWIVFAALSGLAWQWAAVAALVLSVVFLLQDRRAGMSADAQILDFGTIGYFALLSVVAFADPRSVLQTYDSGVSSAWLALIAVAGLLVGRPFTLGIAKRRVAPAVWHTAGFRRVNTVVTSAWTIGFALSALGSLACEAAGSGDLSLTVVQALGFLAPAAFTRYYVKRVRAQAATRDGGASAAPASAVPGSAAAGTALPTSLR